MKNVNTLRELQLITIFIYRDLMKFCEENNIKPYLLGGSLLGAVRHKGFIPWDDDMDICMSRDDYNKLISLSKGNISDKCRIIDPEIDSSFKGYIPLAVYKNSKQASGQYREEEDLYVSVSIFVYDGVPSNRIKRWLYYVHMYMLRAEHALCRANFNNVNTKFARKVGPILSTFFKSKDVYKYKKKILKLQKKYAFSNSKYVSTNADTNAWLEVFERKRFEEAKKVDFENIPSYVFSYYDEHLKRYYGDYMELPPEEDRNPKHSFKVWIEDSFLFKE